MPPGSGKVSECTPASPTLDDANLVAMAGIFLKRKPNSFAVIGAGRFGGRQ